MRILVDSNILFSAILKVDSRLAKILFLISQDPNHTIFLTDQNIKELQEVVARKKPQKISTINRLLNQLTYEIIFASNNQAIHIRDLKDQPILNAAIENDIDIIITGDKDFLSLNLTHPRCMTISEFFDDYYV